MPGYSDVIYMLMVRCWWQQSTKVVDSGQMTETCLNKPNEGTNRTIFRAGYISNVSNDIIREISREIRVRCENKAI